MSCILIHVDRNDEFAGVLVHLLDNEKLEELRGLIVKFKTQGPRKRQYRRPPGIDAPLAWQRLKDLDEICAEVQEFVGKLPEITAGMIVTGRVVFLVEDNFGEGCWELQEG